MGIDYSATGVPFDTTCGDWVYSKHRCKSSPADWLSGYEYSYECFEAACERSIHRRGDYSRAHFPSRNVPLLLFDGDEELFHDIIAVSGSDQTINRVRVRAEPFGFRNYISKLNAKYTAALELHEGLPPNVQSKAARVHDLFPFRLAITGPSGPWPLVRIKSLLDAYNWTHSPNLVQKTRDRADIPALFLTNECVRLYAIVVRARIGDWLVNHQAYWLGLEVTATGLAPDPGAR